MTWVITDEGYYNLDHVSRVEWVDDNVRPMIKLSYVHGAGQDIWVVEATPEKTRELFRRIAVNLPQ